MNNKHSITQIAARLSSETAAKPSERYEKSIEDAVGRIESLCKTVLSLSKDPGELPKVIDKLHEIGVRAYRASSLTENTINAMG